MCVCVCVCVCVYNCLNICVCMFEYTQKHAPTHIDKIQIKHKCIQCL